MRLRKPCPEGRYDAHVDVLPCPGHFADWPKDAQLSCTVRHELHCPGGEFLADDTRIFTADFVKTWRFCPRCGRPNLDQQREEGIEYCLPTNCDIWVHEATFNHQTRQWDALTVREGDG